MAADDGGGGGPPVLTPEQARLVELGLPIMRECAAHVARVFLRRVTAEELYAPGTIALQEAARTYEHGRHVGFPQYAKHHVRGRMIEAVRAEHFSTEARVERAMERAYEILAGHHVIDADLFSDPEEKLVDAARRAADQMMAATYLAGVLEAQEDEGEEAVHRGIDLHRAMATLYQVEREAVELVAVQKMTLDEAAKQLGVHANTVQRRYTRGLDKLRAFLTAEPPEAEPSG